MYWIVYSGHDLVVMLSFEFNLILCPCHISLLLVLASILALSSWFALARRSVLVFRPCFYPRSVLVFRPCFYPRSVLVFRPCFYPRSVLVFRPCFYPRSVLVFRPCFYPRLVPSLLSSYFILASILCRALCLVLAPTLVFSLCV